MARRANERGFTLLEIIMVIVVIALAVSITYPSLSRGTASLQLRAAARGVLNTMRYAREKAITEQSEMKIVVERETQKVTLADAYGEGSRSYTLPMEIRIARMQLAGEDVVEGPLVIRFLPNGSAENAGMILASEKAGLLRIVTDPITGGARIIPASEGDLR
jgi:prepilin-type N-terminal cleavage/methylation domain-containing protein